MKRRISIGGLGTLAFILLFSAIVMAQAVTILHGKVVDQNGNPWVGVTVTIKNPDTGQFFKEKTDKKGTFVQLGLQGCTCVFTVTSEKDNFTYTEKFPIAYGGDNDWSINFKDLMEKQAAARGQAAPAAPQQPAATPSDQKKEKAANPGEQKLQQALPPPMAKDQGSDDKFKAMKQHFQAGRDAMTDSDQLRAQLQTTPPDQKSAIQALQGKIDTDYQTALSEFQQAEQNAGPKDIRNHAMIWSSMGEAYLNTGHYEDATNALQKAIEIQPQPAYYENLSKSLAYEAVAQTDPKASEAKLAEASADCEKANSLNMNPSSICWKNLGIILSNKGRMKEAIAPLQKATQINPLDADAWYSLGGALTGNIESKQEGKEIVFVIPPGTTDAYKKYLQLAPNGQHAKDSKEMLEQLAQYGQGEKTTVIKKNP